MHIAAAFQMRSVRAKQEQMDQRHGSKQSEHQPDLNPEQLPSTSVEPASDPRSDDASERRTPKTRHEMQDESIRQTPGRIDKQQTEQLSTSKTTRCTTQGPEG